MKKSIKLFIALILLGFTQTSIAQYNQRIDCGLINPTQDIKIDQSARIYNTTCYFKLRMQNESKKGIYSLVRQYSDGNIEYVSHKQIVPNTINQPLLYCFKDETIPNCNFEYVLYRVCTESEVVATWTYCNSTQSITTDHESILQLTSSNR